jgi:predicted adenylyl cyclase CyaB
MRNLEAKFRLSNLEVAHAAALALGYTASADFIQHDTFFVAGRGKLKLREQTPEAWLIHYERDRESGLMLSRYNIAPVSDPTRTRETLTRALGMLAEVRKHRTLLTRHNVRLHLDRVETLGAFGEVEAILGERDEEDTGDGHRTARAAVDELLGTLGIGARELIEVSYFELMVRR